MSKVTSKTICVQVDSSMISEMVYNKETKSLEVAFQKGGRYAYSNLPEFVFNGMIAGDNESIGKFFHAHIRNQPEAYPYQKLSP